MADLSLLGHPPQVGIPPRLVAHLPTATAQVAEGQRGFPGVVQGDLQGDTQMFPLDDRCGPAGRRLCKPWPRCPVPCICGSGSTACGARTSSTSYLERSWLGNPQRIPSPGRGGITGENERIKMMNESCVRVLALTPSSLGSPPQHWSTYQSPSHSQLRAGSSKLCSG